MWLRGVGRVSFERDERFGAQRSPESQTLRVLSQLPDTMVFPSGEKATDVIRSLWALVFSLIKVREAASTGREALVSPHSRLAVEKSERTPDFEGAAVASGHNRLSVGREVHRAYGSAVGVRLLARELQCGCVRRQELSVLRKAAIE